MSTTTCPTVFGCYNAMDSNDLRCSFSDMHKDVYGIRSTLPKTMSHDDMVQECIRMDKLLEEAIEEEKKQKDRNAIVFEETINKMIILGANSKDQALEWLLDSHIHKTGDYIERFIVMDFLFEYGIDFCQYGDDLRPQLSTIVRRLLDRVT